MGIGKLWFRRKVGEYFDGWNYNIRDINMRKVRGLLVGRWYTGVVLLSIIMRIL